jgi:hypothetical protein
VTEIEWIVMAMIVTVSGFTVFLGPVAAMIVGRVIVRVVIAMIVHSFFHVAGRFGRSGFRFGICPHGTTSESDQQDEYPSRTAAKDPS